MRRVLRIVGRAVFVFVLLIWPVIPIESAPVVPNPVYPTISVPPLQLMLYLMSSPMGVAYVWRWYTNVAILVVIGVGYLGWVLVSRRLADPPES